MECYSVESGILTSLEREDKFFCVCGTHCLITANNSEMVVFELQIRRVSEGRKKGRSGSYMNISWGGVKYVHEV